MLICDKVCLGPVLEADSPFFFNWFNTIGLVHMNGPYRPVDQIGFREWFAGLGNNPSKVMFAIRRQGDLGLLGYVQVGAIHPVFRSGEIGILIGDEQNRGRGFGQEAMALAIAFAWRDLNLRRLSLSLAADNDRAAHVYEKAGFRYEGTLRQAWYIDGRYLDVTLMGLVRP